MVGTSLLYRLLYLFKGFEEQEEVIIAALFVIRLRESVSR